MRSPELEKQGVSGVPWSGPSRVHRAPRTGTAWPPAPRVPPRPCSPQQQSVPSHSARLPRPARGLPRACPPCGVGGPSWERVVAGLCVSRGTGDPPLEGSDRVPSSRLPGESPRPVRGARRVRLLSSPSVPGAFCISPGAERCRPSDASLPGTESCRSGLPRLCLPSVSVSRKWQQHSRDWDVGSRARERGYTSRRVSGT